MSEGFSCFTSLFCFFVGDQDNILVGMAGKLRFHTAQRLFAVVVHVGRTNLRIFAHWYRSFQLDSFSVTKIVSVLVVKISGEMTGKKAAGRLSESGDSFYDFYGMRCKPAKRPARVMRRCIDQMAANFI